MACHSDHAAPRLTQRSRKPFSYALLRVAVRERCEACHSSRTASLRCRISGNCQHSHDTARWKPATFDHAKLLVLDRDHDTDTDCVTCRTGNDYSRYTCYGCHEHRPEKVRAEHREEGTRDFEDCVKCHRRAEEEPRRGDSGERRKRD